MEAPDFVGFYEATWPAMAAFATSLLRDPGRAEELTQESLTRTYVRYPLLRDPQAYAYRVVRNLVIDEWKRQVRDQQLLVHAAESALPESDPDLLTVVRGLPGKHREVLLLHYWSDLPVEQIAQVLRCPEGTVKRRLHDARKVLEQQWKEGA